MRASKDPDSAPARTPSIRLRRDRLQAVMELAGWSKKDLATHAGLDQSAIGRLLNGELQVGPGSIPGLISAVRERFGDSVHTCTLFETIAPNGTVMHCLCGFVGLTAPAGADHADESVQ